MAGHLYMFASGACVAYAESVDTLQADFQLVSPSFATSVPRVFERIYDAIREDVRGSGTRERIFEWAVEVSQRYFESAAPGVLSSAQKWLADLLVFRQVKQALGGNVEALISGGGSLSADLCAMYHGMGLPIYEGYGLTEASPVVTTNPPEEPKVGTIGLPLVDEQVRIDTSLGPKGDLPERMGRYGELLVRGPNVFEGYWNRPEETEAAFTDDAPTNTVERSRWKSERPASPEPQGVPGDAVDSTSSGSPERSADLDEASEGLEEQGASGRWLRTGDIVQVRPDGYLSFLERAKQVLVLSTGRNVAPGPIEDGFSASAVVEQVMVVGDDRRFAGAIIVPNFEGLERWADGAGVDLPDDPAEICGDGRVRERVQRAVDEVNADWEDHERIKQFVLVSEAFTEENDLLTPTLKKKRRQILEEYEDEVESLYEAAAARH
jgi:long-chain acyl-CoA synthetase